MISKQVKKTIVAALGKQYSPRIIAHLTEKEIFNENGQPYKADTIQKIVNGTPGRENLTVETEILDLVATVQQQRLVIKEKKSRIVKTK